MDSENFNTLLTILAIPISAGLSVYISVINEKRKIYNNFLYMIKSNSKSFLTSEIIQDSLTKMFNTYDFLKMEEYNIKIEFLEDIKEIRNSFIEEVNNKNSFEKIMRPNNQRGRNNVLLDLYSEKEVKDIDLLNILVNIDIEHFFKTKEIIEKNYSNNEFFNAKTLKEEYDTKSNSIIFKRDNDGDKSILDLMHQADEYSTSYMEAKRFFHNFKQTAKRINVFYFIGKDIQISFTIFMKKLKEFLKNINDFFIPIC